MAKKKAVEKKAAKIKRKETEIPPIPPVPSLPPGVIDAIDREKLVVFIGAGVSRLVGCKGWDELARELVHTCYELEYINYRESETLRLEKNHKKTITICYELLKIARKKNTFFAAFNRALAGKRNILGSDNIYKQLAKIKGIFITTNADEHFDKHFTKDRVYSDIDEFTSKTLETRTLYHIHGKKRPRKSLVFTVDRYIETYSDGDFCMFLEGIFGGEYVILFLGYGLSEFELLDFVITKMKNRRRAIKEPLKHFILLPYYREEVHLMKMDQLYYKHLGISVLGYQKDRCGYKQLYHVMKKWHEEMTKKTVTIEKDFAEIDKFIEQL